MSSICKVASLDHLVLTVKNLDAAISFYSRILGMTPIKFKGVDNKERSALQFGNQKINLHEVGKEIKPHASVPISGSADLCFVSHDPLTNWIELLKANKVEVIEGPVKRTGAVGPINSIYIRDPDGNLVEISNYTEQ